MSTDTFNLPRLSSAPADASPPAPEASAKPAVVSQPAGGSAGRDPFFDNSKYLLVVLVAVGHGLGPIAGDMRAVTAVYMVIYSFHMPVFVLMCGYFSRSFTGRPDQIRKLISGVLVPYVIFYVLYQAVYKIAWGREFKTTLLTPDYLLWFMVALFIWRITAPLWRSVRWPVAIAIGLSILSGVVNAGYELSLSRVLTFLPWFVLGLKLRREHFRALRARIPKRYAFLTMVLALAGSWAVAPYVTSNWLLMQMDNDTLGVSAPVYIGMRIALFGVSAVLSLAFLALIPRRELPITALGAATMFPYLLHGLALKTFEGLGGYETVYNAGILGAAVLVCATVALALLLSTAPVRYALRPLVEPRFPRWLEPVSPGQHRRTAFDAFDPTAPVTRASNGS
ncbi:acyltransferase family protein [Streptomyces sp. ODS28]|uniref:acyltransferase family protein n=1 Tax=Streptomyces sp. ODS28 TaxID=3136688 RepID=UPI0031E919DF